MLISEGGAGQIDYPFVGIVGTCMGVAGSPVLELEAIVLMEGGGGLGVAGTLGLLELEVEDWKKTDGTF